MPTPLEIVTALSLAFMWISAHWHFRAKKKGAGKPAPFDNEEITLP